MSAAAAAEPSLGNTLGALFLCNVAAGILFGITTVQTWIYFLNNRDIRTVRLLVYSTWVLAAAHIAFVSFFLYRDLVTYFGNLLGSVRSHQWAGTALIITSAISDMIVRGVFIYRVAKFTQIFPLTIFLGLLTLVATVTSLVFSVDVYRANAQSVNLIAGYAWLMDVSFGCAVAADLVLSVALCMSLLIHRRQSLRTTDRVVNVLMMYAINTGVLVAICTLVELVCYATMPDNFIYLAIYFTLPGLYVNALLATLNARPSLRQHVAGELVSIPHGVDTTTARTEEVVSTVGTIRRDESQNKEIAEQNRDRDCSEEIEPEKSMLAQQKT